MKHLHLDSGKKSKTAAMPKDDITKTKDSVVETKIVTAQAATSADAYASFDTEKSFTGNAPIHKGEPKLQPFVQEDETLLFADDPRPSPPAGGRLIDKSTTTKVTGTLKYSFGDTWDTPTLGGKGRIVITRENSDGARIVYDTGMVSTYGKPVKVELSDLDGNALYRVTLIRETWRAGTTECSYDLHLHQSIKSAAQYEVKIKEKVPATGE